MAVSWITPKTNWTTTDSFEPVDFNRIKNNIIYLNEHLNNPIDLIDMGANVTNDYQPWNVDYFNALEDNLHNINQMFNGGSTDIGLKKTFYRNGAFINATELNRIEKATVDIKYNQEVVKANQRRVPFRLGAFKAIRN